jgi:hypothetical protein
MALTKTRNDLVNQALSNLGKLAAGQTADAEDFDAVDSHVDGTLSRLAIRDIATVTDDDAIPVEWFDPIAVIVADDAAPEFGSIGIPRKPGAPDPVDVAEATLRELNRGKPTGEHQHGEYF